ncbi:Flavodoxin [Raoultella terrigena]|uniref:Flavodoxin n=1 Tax=Raoultella terrigena TaxID=577 RepID=A0A3P8KSZ2_RAOTE|nr:Flavodoxin [Raoultella terrigena]
MALYGMGDQLGYGEWFLDALGMLHDRLATRGVKFIGYWPTEGYEFTSRKPIVADGQLFVGLALDETNQYDLSGRSYPELVRANPWGDGRTVRLNRLSLGKSLTLQALSPAPVCLAPAGANRATPSHPCYQPPPTGAGCDAFAYGADAAASRC